MHYGLRIANYEPHTRMAPHCHDEASFCVVLGGRYEEKILGQSHDHGAGHMLFYPAGSLHSQAFRSQTTRKLIFTPKASSMDYLREQGATLLDAPAVCERAILPLASRIVAEVKRDDPFSGIAVEGMLLELTATFGRACRTASVAKLPVWLSDARDLLHAAGGTALSNVGLATQVGRHPVHLAREFRRYFGSTIGSTSATCGFDARKRCLSIQDLDLRKSH